MPYLLDTNVLSEIKKGDKAAFTVQAWAETVSEDETFVSVMVIGEIRRGIELTRRTDPPAATSLEWWLSQVLEAYATRTFPVTAEIADRWGRLSPMQKLPPVDGLMAATALVHDLTIVTRNTRDFERSGARLLNPFIG